MSSASLAMVLRPRSLRPIQNAPSLRPLSLCAIRHHAKPPSSTNFSSSSSSSHSSKQKPIVLEQPDSFRPPSHPARLRRKKPRMVYGRELTSEDREDMESKTYPYSMPGKNTMMYQVMHARWFHAFFTISILTTLAIYMWILDFHKHNKYPSLLPSSSLFFQHPISFLSQYYQVWRLHQADVDREFREKRDQRARDVEGRRRYREAHDLPEVTGLAQWLGLGTREEEERVRRKRAAAGGELHEEQGQEVLLQLQQDAVQRDVRTETVSEEAEVQARAGVQDGSGERPKRRVFLGIWGW